MERKKQKRAANFEEKKVLELFKKSRNIYYKIERRKKARQEKKAA